jgi:transposase
VFFFDEGRFGLMPSVGRCWALRGKRITSPVSTGYKNFYAYTSVSPYTGASFTLFLPWVNTDIMNLYLKRFSAAHASTEILLIMDQAGWHCSKDLKVPGNILIEKLPPYSPELNPVERLWQWLRRHVCKNRLYVILSELENELSVAFRNFSNPFLARLCGCSYL